MVSVCLTAYNRAAVIGRTIESILAQDYEDFELVITDDASTDSTEDVCRSYARQDVRIRYFRNSTRLEMPGNLNAGIRRCRGVFVANLHDGDSFHPSLLRLWRAALERHSGAAFVFNAYESIDSNGTRRVWRAVPPFPELLPTGFLTRLMVQRFDSPVWGTVMARRSCYDASGLFNPRYSYYADVEMWMRLNLHYPVAYVDRPLITLTAHEPERPYAFVNWGLERCLFAMREETLDALYPNEPLRVARDLARLRRRRDSRWARLALACLRRRDWPRLADAACLFLYERSLMLKIVAALVWPAALVGSRADRWQASSST